MFFTRHSLIALFIAFTLTIHAQDTIKVVILTITPHGALVQKRGYSIFNRRAWKSEAVYDEKWKEIPYERIFFYKEFQWLD